MMGTSVAEFHLGSHRDQKLALSLDVAHVGDILQDDGLIRKKSGGHGRQRGILGAADANGSEQGIATADHKLVHWVRLLPFQTGCACQHYYMRVFSRA